MTLVQVATHVWESSNSARRYLFNYLDRNAITVARLDGLEAELNLSSTQYQTCVSILFVGYILGQIPSSEYLTPIPRSAEAKN